MTTVEHAPDIDVVRALSAAPELRAATIDGSLGVLSGHFSTFNDWYSVSSWYEGDFLERVAPGAFKQTIREDRDSMRCLFDHGYDYQIGNKVLGPIDELREDETGPYYDVSLFDTTYNRDLLPGLKARVYGASFRMRVREESWNDEPEPSDYNPKGLPERTILGIKTYEFGPVTFPANPSATAGMRSQSVRCLTDSYYDRLRQRDPGAFEDAVRAAGRTLPDFTGRPDARRTGGGDSDPNRTERAGSTHPHDDSTQRDRVLRALGAI